MSFAVPRHVPDFEDPRRKHEDGLWAAAGRSRSGGLPMYKDKPYNYPASQRPAFRRKRYLAVIALAAFTLLYFFGSFGPKDLIGNTVSDGKSLLESIASRGGGVTRGKVDWSWRQEQVKKAMELTWSGYEKYAWGYDEYHPISKKGRMMVPPTGLGWIIVDALDTMMLMNMTTQLKHARQWISKTLTYDLNHEVNTFETTIRMMGGLLSAHYLQTSFPNMCPVDLSSGGEDLYIEKATDLGSRLLGAFDSPTGIPWSSVNLKATKGIPSHADAGAASLAEATTVQLELKYLAKLTGEKDYWDRAEKVIEVVDKTGEVDGLKGIFISPETGEQTSRNVRLGSRGDSYYEYLIKQYLQTSKKESIYLEMWEEALQGVRKHLITYSSPSNFTILAERPHGIGNALDPKMDHLVCFMPGTIALAATNGLTVSEAKKQGVWGERQQADLDLAEELLKTCIGMYKVTATGLAPEITYFHIHQPPSMLKGDAPIPGPAYFDTAEDASWRQDYIIKPADRHNLQRPETVESLFYFWRITGKEYYRQVGWEIFEAFVKYTTAPEGAGFTSISDVLDPEKVNTRDNMESFWPAETLKYFYLLFGPDDVLPLTDVVFNTEAHPFPVFEMGKLFWTGWKRGEKKVEEAEHPSAHDHRGT